MNDESFRLDESEGSGESKDLAEFSNQLTFHLYRWDCPEPGELSDYYLGLLGESRQADIAAHVNDCIRCQEELEILATFLNDTDAHTLPTKAGNIRTIFIAVQEMFKSAVSLPLQPQLAMRGEDTPPQKLTFVAEDNPETIELYLGVNKKQSRYVVNAQFVMSDYVEQTFVDAIAEIWQEYVLVASTLVDDLGTFYCDLENPSPLTLRITSQNGPVLFGRIGF